jgi:hypothetical protein
MQQCRSKSCGARNTMSILSFVSPIEFAAAAVAVLRPIAGIAALIGLVLLFRPLLVGIWRTLAIIVKPRQTLEQRINRSRFKSAIALNRAARETGMSQPNLVSELRSFASRD